MTRKLLLEEHQMHTNLYKATRRASGLRLPVYQQIKIYFNWENNMNFKEIQVDLKVKADIGNLKQS